MFHRVKHNLFAARSPRRSQKSIGRSRKSHHRNSRSGRLTFEPLETRLVLDGGMMISEFMALNDSGLQDFEDEYSDWLEIYNSGNEAVDLTDWALRDGGNEWVFPAISLGPGEYRVIFASAKDLRDPAAELHTNFNLRGAGEYLGLLNPAGEVVHEYNEYPEQVTDISYGIGQSVDRTDLVASGATATYVVPDGDQGPWTAVGFDDGEWNVGQTALGFIDTVPGFAVRNIKASVAVGHLDTALQVIDTPSMQSYVNSETAPVINYFNSDGHGHYLDEAAFPGFTSAMDDYVVEATGYVTIPAAGDWSFGVNSDDGFSLELDNGTLNHFMSYPTPRGASDTIATFTFPEADTYNLRLVFYERAGGSSLEMFAAQGAHGAFSAGAFDLVGDTSNGGLAVVSEAVSGGGAGGVTFAGLIETDVEDAMKETGASLFVRIPFTLDDPSQFESLTLRMKYDDGYVAYLNGQEIAQSNAPDPALWSSHATADRTDAEATAWQNVDVSGHLNLLQNDNVLAIHAMNVTAGDDDFLVLPELAQILAAGQGEHFFDVPTPGEANAEEYWLRAENPDFSHERGFYESSFNLALGADGPGAEIYYTTDGSAPSDVNGTLYTNPIPITTTTAVRAAVLRQFHAPSATGTQTYVFLDEVLEQPSDPAGFPGSWANEGADYEMDPQIVGALDAEALKDALRSLPTMSIVMNQADVFGSGGIYSRPNTQGLERAASLEYFDPATGEEFQLNAGARIYGGVGRQPRFKKHSFRFVFKSDYGPTKLRFPLFEDATDEFDTIILRSNFNDAWVWGGAPTQFIRDEFAGRLQNAMGDPGRHGTFVHLYVNGLYWGLYNPVERPDTSFSASYFGGERDDWDGINSGAVVNTGGLTSAEINLRREAWNELMNQASAGLSTNDAYQRVQGNNVDGTNNPAYENYLDVDNYINFLLLNFWAGNNDWTTHNWYAGRMRGPDSTGWKSYSWDAEWIVGMRSGVNDNSVNDSSGGNHLIKPYGTLKNNAEFQLRFADHVHEHFFNGGVLSPDYTVPLYASMAEGIEQSVLAESARWGDVVREPAYDFDDWDSQRNWILNTYLPQRTNVVLGQLQSAGLYPSIAAPSFRVNGAPQHGGTIELGDALTVTAPSGTIYYTTDGTDPRDLYGPISGTARVYSGPIALDTAMHVKSRVYSGGQWSALNEATFYVDLAPAIRITELMFNPADPTPEETAAGHLNNDDFEYLEIRNISADTLPLTGLRLSDGIEYTFAGTTIGPGEYVVLAKDPAAFSERYDTFAGQLVGPYDGSLNNGGERVQLDAPIGGVIHAFEYNDNWYGHTDGDGFSLTIRDDLGDLDNWTVKDGWRASAAVGGTPGYGDTLVDPGSVVITEVLAHSDAPFVDTIELHNVSDVPVDVSGWFLSDRKTDDLGNPALTLYEIPTLPPIPAGGYLVLDETTHFGTAFALSELGDDLYLSSNAGGTAGGYREHVDFGASPRNVSFGLYTKSTGGTDFTLLSAHTFGADNAYPLLEDLVINEVLYHPTDPTPEEIAAGGSASDEAYEFVEIYNASPTTTYALGDYYLGSGVGFTFGWTDAEDGGDESWTLEAGATATWDATLPAGLDTYEVFARWDLLDGEGDRRELDGSARYTIDHAAGQISVSRDQEPEDDDEGPGYIDAEGWVSLGTYEFDAAGRVVLTRVTDNPANWTIADEVKFVSATHEAIVETPALDSWYTANGPAAIGPGEYVVVVGNYASFDARYDVAGNAIAVAGQYTGNLSNGGEKLKLFRLGQADPTGVIPNYRSDYVNYDDVAPWPIEADGQGAALNRLHTDQYGNDPINWQPSAALGTPGAENEPIDHTPPSTPQDLTAQVTVGPDTITLNWTASADAETFVDYYQVYRDGELLATPAAPTYADANVEPVTAYAYYVTAVNRDGYTSAASVPVAVAIPGIVSYSVPDKRHVEITFSEPLDPATAAVLANYTMTGGTLTAADLSPGGTTVVLTTGEEFVILNAYTITLNGVTTLSGNEMSDGQQIAFVYEPQGAGFILREYWSGIGGTAVANLTTNPNYPDTPTGTTYPTLFDGPVNWQENYGTRIHGYVHPPVSGAYTFWISGDDNCELWLSTDDDPANAQLIASVPGWSNWRTWDRYAAQQSAPIELLAGQKYYIMALHKEHGGGDSISVRWQLPDGSWENPADPNEPIPGVRLSPYAGDATPPLADITNVSPDPRITAVDSIEIVFSEAVNGFGLSDLRLTRDGGGNLLTGGQPLTSTDDVTWTLGGLTDLTAAGGTYTLSLAADGSGIQDILGNAMTTDASDTWWNAVAGPTADVVDVAPDPHTSPVDQLQIVFDQPVIGLDLADLDLSRDGGADLLTGAESLDTGDGVTWTLGGLAGLTTASGTYTLTLTAADSGIENGAGDRMAFDATETWTTDTIVPTADVVDVTPDPRVKGVGQIEIVLSEPVGGFDLDDLTFSRNGGPNLLTDDQTLQSADDTTWTLGGLAELTSSGGAAVGFVVYNDHVIGNGTHPHATAYATNGTASGLLKDVESGAETNATLTVTSSGIHFAGSQGTPAAGTDAHAIFDGYVFLGGGNGASLEIEGSNNDHYTHTFSGLADAATYDFHGTAIRGNAAYTNRWTTVTLVGAEAATADHSTGVGVIVISDTAVALWTGHNSAANQGFVVGWTGIDSGDDGEFQVVSTQYRGPTPGVGTGTANGSKGYGLGGIRLTESAANGLPGSYTLTLTAAGSGIEDAARNPLAGDATETFVILPNGQDTEPPVANVVDVSPDPRETAIDSVEIVFSEPISGLDVGDLSLTLDGGGELLTGGESLTTADDIAWTLGDLTGLTGESGDYTLTLTAAGSGVEDMAGNPLSVDASDTWTVELPVAIEGRWLFYNRSSFDGNSAAANAADDAAIATDKQALRPGATASFANYSGFSLGLNGIMIDVSGLPTEFTPDAGDFEFRVGNDANVGGWAAAAVPETVAVRRGAGVGGSDRVTLIWADHAIRKQWLEVTVLAAGLGMDENDVFYFGNAVAEAGNSTANAQVTTTDLLLARNNQSNFLTALRLIEAPDGEDAAASPAEAAAWLSDVSGEQSAASQPQEQDAAAVAVDALLSSYYR